jgi:hypothetical protein
MVALSVLDLVPVPEGHKPADALAYAKDLAQHVERLGYQRYWVAEHHNMVGIASAATSVVIGYIAAHTNTIRVGAVGIMLPNRLERLSRFIPAGSILALAAHRVQIAQRRWRCGAI